MKTETFSKKQKQVSAIAKALAHPARVAILELLMSRNTCICGDIVDELPFSQSTVSQHLKELKDAGLIKGEISGVRTCYCIDSEAWESAKNTLNALFESFKETSTCC